MIIFGENGSRPSRMVGPLRTGMVALCLGCAGVVILERPGPRSRENFLADPTPEELDAILDWMGFPVGARQSISGGIHVCQDRRRRRGRGATAPPGL